MTLTVQLRTIKWTKTKTKKKQEEKSSSLVDYKNLKKRKNNSLILINTASSFTVWGSFGNFSKQSKCICDFLKCKQILETLITTGEIINVLSACNHLLSKNKSVYLALYCNHTNSDVVSVTAAFDKQVDNCDNVTGANEIFNKMSAE